MRTSRLYKSLCITSILFSVTLTNGCGLFEKKSTRFNAPPRFALLLPTTGPHAKPAHSIYQGILAAHHNNASTTLKPSLKFYDTNQGLNLATAYRQATSEGATFIIGPLTKPEVETLSHQGPKVPVLALNYSHTHPTAENFYEFGLMPEDEVKTAVDEAKGKGLIRATVFAPRNDWGRRVANIFHTYWEAEGGIINSTHWYPPSERNTDTALHHFITEAFSNETQTSDMIFLVASTEQATRLNPLLSLESALPIYATSSVYTPGTSANRSLDGIIFCDIPWLLQNHSKPVHATTDDHQYSRFFALGLDAYKLALLLQQKLSLPASGIAGHTGELHLQPHHRITRRLLCATFKAGIPTLDERSHGIYVQP